MAASKKSLDRAVTLVATFVSPGVAVGGGGFVIIGGKIVKIPPRGPIFKQLAAVAKAVSAGKLKAPARARG